MQLNLTKKYHFCQNLHEEPKIPINDYEEIVRLRKLVSESIGLGRYESAMQSCMRHLDLLKKYYPGNHPAIYSALNNFGLVNKIVGNHTEAQLIFEKVYDGYSKLFGEEHKSTLVVM